MSHSRRGCRASPTPGSSFARTVPNRYADRPQELSYFGLTRSGVAGPLGTPAAPPPGELRMPDGERIPVEQGAALGNLDYTTPTMERYKLTSPEDFHAFDWLSLNAAPGPDGSRFIVSDGESAGTRAIGFNALAGRDSEQVRVGACPQWKGYAQRPALPRRDARDRAGQRPADPLAGRYHQTVESTFSSSSTGVV